MAAAVAAAPVAAQGFGEHSDRLEARMGIGFYNTGPLTTFGFDDFVLNGELLFASPGVLSAIGAPRPYLGFDFTGASNPIHFVYGGLSWDYHLTNRFYLSGSLGGAINTADQLVGSPDTRSLGTRANIHLGAAIGYDFTPNLTTQFYWNHFSNGYLVNPNEGHDSMGIRFGARF